MPVHPLISDHAISLSATLAATIGLEEAILLSVLNDAARLQTQPQARLNSDTLRRQVPFWDDNTCLLYTSPSPRDLAVSRMPSSA